MVDLLAYCQWHTMFQSLVSLGFVNYNGAK